MRRVDRLLAQAGLLCGMRAARARGRIPLDGYDWIGEAEAAQAILEDLAEADGLGTTDPRRKVGPVRIVDLTVLDPFIDRCEAALRAVIAEMDPRATMLAALAPKLSKASTSTLSALLRSKRGVDQVHQSARDVATLALEATLFEAVRRIFWSHDLDRLPPPKARPLASVRDGVLVTPSRPAGKKTRKTASDDTSSASGRRSRLAASALFPTPVAVVEPDVSET